MFFSSSQPHSRPYRFARRLFCLRSAKPNLTLGSVLLAATFVVGAERGGQRGEWRGVRPGLVELGLHVDRVGSLGPLDTPRKVHEDHHQRMPAAAVANRGYGVLLTRKRKSKGRLSMVAFQLASLSDSILCGRFSYSRSCSGTGHPDERARVGVGGCSPRRVRECPSTATYPS